MRQEREAEKQKMTHVWPRWRCPASSRWTQAGSQPDPMGGFGQSLSSLCNF
jgi:hypothetical protein